MNVKIRHDDPVGETINMDVLRRIYGRSSHLGITRTGESADFKEQTIPYCRLARGVSRYADDIFEALTRFVFQKPQPT